MNELYSLKLSNTSIHTFEFSLKLKELDLSFLNVTILSQENLREIEWISLTSVNTDVSFGMFLSNLTKYVDFSFNPFNFSILNVLGTSLETLKLRQTNLNKIEAINFKNITSLKFLDLSLNNLTFISPKTFEYMLNLEYLDLSSNSLYEFNNILNKLVLLRCWYSFLISILSMKI